MRLIPRSSMYLVLPAFLIACCAVVAQSQRNEKIDPAVLADAPIVPQMLVDSDGTLHFGPRTVPPPALESAGSPPLLYPSDAAAGADIGGAGRLGLGANPGGQTRAGRGRREQGNRPQDLSGDRGEPEDRGRWRHHLLAQGDPGEEPQEGADGVRDGRRGDRRSQPGPVESDQGQLSRRRAFDPRQ